MAVFLGKHTQGRLTEELRKNEYGTFGTFHQTEEYNGTKVTKFFDFKLSKNCVIEGDTPPVKGSLLELHGLVDSYDDKNGHQKLALLIYKLVVVFPPFEEESKPAPTTNAVSKPKATIGGLGF